MTMLPILETQRLRVRPFSLDDLEPSKRFLDYADDERRAYLEWSKMNYNLLGWLRQPPYGDRGVELRASGELIGVVGYVPYLIKLDLLPGYQEFPREPEACCSTAAVGLYYAIAPDHRLHRYASEAAGAMIDYAFKNLRLDQIVATTDHNNLGSQGVMRRLGMRILRNPHPEPPWLQVVGVLKNDDCR